MAALPIIDNQVLTPEQDMELSDEDRAAIDAKQEQLQSEMRETLREVEQSQKEGKDRISELDQRVISFAVDHLINDLKNKHKEYEAVVNFLTEARAFLLKNVQAFKKIKQM